MQVEFFFNWTQEYEGAEITYFPAIILSETCGNGEIKYWSEASFFIQSMNTTDEASRVLKIINFYKSLKIVSRIELNLWNGVEAIIENQHIMFRRNKVSTYEDQFNIDFAENIIPRWIDYLMDVKKDTIIFEL